jgi:hypothetical protein
VPRRQQRVLHVLAPREPERLHVELPLSNGALTLGLFRGMFERNMLTFNPGWDDQARPVPDFTDVREHQRRLEAKGLEIMNPADTNGTGPASFMLLDPDGNPIVVDQHV